MSEKDERKDLTGETVHGIKDGVNWNRWKSWDKKLDEIEKEAKPERVAEEPAPAPKIIKAVVEPEPAPAPVAMDDQLVVKMATWLRKKEGLKDKHARYMQKIKNDPALYNELKNLKRW